VTHHLRPAAALATLAVLALVAGGATPAAAAPGYAYGQLVDYPLVFPADQPVVTGYRTHFWDQRYNGDHHAQDLMGPKMTEVYAVATGTVRWVNWSSHPEDLNPEKCCSAVVQHDDGWETVYIHLNNDTPGTDDGQGWGIAPGVVPGARVERGQLIGWVGDSGNAEGTDPHLHFELWAPGDVAVDSFESLKEAQAARGSVCAGQKATRVDTDGDHRIGGTPFDDVIAGTGDADTVIAGAGDDLVCGGAGDDHLEGGPGADRLLAGEGNDFLAGGGDGVADILLGGPGDDDLTGGGGGDFLAGHDGDDRLRGGPGDDDLLGGPGRDLLVASPGTDYLNGGRGRDTVTFASAPAGVAADLAAGTAAGGAAAALVGFEMARGSSHDDALTGDGRRNTLLGLGGDDTLAGAAGNDRLLGGEGDDTLLGGEGDDFLDGGDGEADSADGGDGDDTCLAENPAACEA
jgi:Ca2+-binding RTX toxin-like protein